MVACTVDLLACNVGLKSRKATWLRPQWGESFVVLEVQGNKVHVENLDTGRQEWIDIKLLRPLRSLMR